MIGIRTIPTRIVTTISAYSHSRINLMPSTDAPLLILCRHKTTELGNDNANVAIGSISAHKP